MYVDPNFKTKKDLKASVKEGRFVTVFQPNQMFEMPEVRNKWVSVEGPHYPEPHRWYAQVWVDESGIVRKVK